MMMDYKRDYKEVKTDYDQGTLYLIDPNTLVIADVRIGRSEIPSIGRYVVPGEWYDYYSPEEAAEAIPGFSFEARYEGAGVIVWSFVIPIPSLNEGWGIATIGDGDLNKDEVKVILDYERYERGE